MKANKIMVLLLAVVLIFVTTACKKTGQDHEQGYNGEWYYNSEYHWRDPDETGDNWKSEHNFINDVCNLCGYSRKTNTVDPGEDPSDKDPSGGGSSSSGDNWEPGGTVVDGLSFTMLYDADSTIGYSVGVGTWKGKTEITIPAEFQGSPVVAIDDRGFYGESSLQSITLPDTITSIGYEAFLNCTALKKFVMPDSVVDLDHRVFYGCTNLSEVKLSSNLKVINSKTFAYCDSLKEIVFPEGFKEIYNEAFWGCHSLEKVVIPKSMDSFNGGAFGYSENIKKVVGYDIEAWMGINFSSYQDNPLWSGADLYFNSTGSEVLFTDLVVPDVFDVVKKCMFVGCNSLKNVTIPERVTEIGIMAFAMCQNLETITANGIKIVDDQTFYEMASLRSITVKNAESVGRDAFYNCHSLTTIYFGSALKFLGQRCLAHTGLKDIHYDGTSEQWNQVTKTSGSNAGNCWNYDVGSYTIHLNDGKTINEVGANYTN